MNRLILVPLAALGLAACSEAPKTENAPSKEEPAKLLSTFRVSNPAANAQMTHGFSPTEANQWRWVSSKFGVTLAPPEGAAQRGARLSLKFSYPEANATLLKAITLTASVNGTAQKPQKYDSAGNYTYAVDLPADMFRGGQVSVEFATDKFVPPGPVEKRELALIVTDVGLTTAP
jgi:hypothetical protein